VIHKPESLFLRDVQRTHPPSPITERDGARANTERRHQIVEKAVEVIGPELDDIVGREFLHESAKPLERRSDALLGFVARRSSVQQRRMGSADDGHRHDRILRTAGANCRSIGRNYRWTSEHWLSDSGRLTASPGKVCRTL
jgi:hypothetical protein